MKLDNSKIDFKRKGSTVKNYQGRWKMKDRQKETRIERKKEEIKTKMKISEYAIHYKADRWTKKQA